MTKLLLPLAVAVGLLIAYVDSRPNWDDTGITAVALFATSGAFGLAAPRRPWLWALAVGLWIPLYGIITARNYGSPIALAIAFVGACAGMAARRAVSWTKSVESR